MRIRDQKVKNLALLRLFVAIAISCMLGVKPASAQILLQDDFEDPVRSNTLWTFKNPNGFGVVLDPSKAHSGTGVLELRYDPGTTGPGFEIANFSRSVSEVYHRWYQKWSANWVWGGVAQKLTKIQSSQTGDFAYITEWGKSELEVVTEGTSFPKEELDANVSRVPFERDRWYCIEVHAKPNTPGASDGEVQIWIDGKLTLQHTGKRWWTYSLPLNLLMISAYYNKGGNTPNGVPHLQYSWHDDHVVSTQRIGCLPNVADKNPPNAPTGVRIETQ